MKNTAAKALCLLLFSATTWAKLPPPSDEVKAKAAEAAAKTAHGGKVDNYKLCKSMDQIAATYFAQAKQANKALKPATETPACADPGTFVYPPPAAATAPAAPGAPGASAAVPPVANAANSAAKPTAAPVIKK